MLCAGTDKVELYYSNNFSPFHLHAGNLYAAVLPVRAAWSKTEEAA